MLAAGEVIAFAPPESKPQPRPKQAAAETQKLLSVLYVRCSARGLGPSRLRLLIRRGKPGLL